MRIGAAKLVRAPCTGRILALEKTIRQFAEQPVDIVIVPKIGTSLDTLGETQKGFGIRYGKSRLNVNRTKRMQEIVCGCAVCLLLMSFSMVFYDPLNIVLDFT